MKKLSIFFALLAGIAVMTGCKKDQDAVTFKAVIDQDSKAYFGTSVRPYWDQDDKLRVMGGGYDDTITCSLTGVTQTNATVQDVASSSNHYYSAIYPVEAAEKIGIPDDDDGTTQAVIYYRPDQIYHWDEQNSRQRINMPMGAVANDATKTFYFKNLCSILRLHVTNNYGRTVKITRVTVQASGAYVAGSADVTLTPNGNPQVIMDGLADHVDNVLSLYPENNVGFIKELAAGAAATIDIVVPPFDASSLNIELELFEANGTTFIGNSDAIIDNPPSLELNKIVTLNLNTDHHVEPADYAYLESGPEFYVDMHDPDTGLLSQLQQGEKVINIKFNRVQNENNIPASAVNVKANHSAYNIWAYLIADDPQNPNNGNKSIQVDCVVPLIYADKDCSHMFEGLKDLETIQWTNNATSGFQTEDVVDMSYMFAGCEKLTSLAGSNFNTTNVRTMAYMFYNCKGFMSGSNMGTTNFNTHNLQDMEAMFMGCSMLQDPRLTSFNTRRVTNMQNLFNGCTKISSDIVSGIFMENFVISPGTNLLGAFVNAGPTWNSAHYLIHCSTDVETILRQQDATVIDLNKATFSR